MPSLTGTRIEAIDSDAETLSARTHRQSAFTENPVELWYYRDSAWHLFPVQPSTSPEDGLELTQTYKLPATLGFTLPDPDGLYSAENLESPYNRNQAGGEDPLLDEARKICLRVGTHCYANLAAGIVPTSSIPPYAGPLYVTTDGILGDITNSISGYVEFAPTDTTPITLTVDLGSVKSIRHGVIRFATDLLTATCTLPAAVQMSVSVDGTAYSALPKRPVGGPGGGGEAPGDWAESPTGQTVEIAFCDANIRGRYVKFIVTPTGAQTILIDELAVYGGSSFRALGANLFTGYMGDQIDYSTEGVVRCLAIDVLKKLADNNDVFVTAPYRLTSAGAVELGDIVHSLLTSTAYWKALNTVNDYDHPFAGGEIGWSSGSRLTGLQYPLWQGQNNSLLGYCQELFAVVGWSFYADGDGVIQAVEPPYTQRLPDRVCIAAPDGNYDVSHCRRQRTGKNMRNRVIVQTGKSKATGSGSITLFEPNSIARYGTRTTRITDPLAATTYLRQKVGNFFLRDYAWNLQGLSNTIRPQFETLVKQVFGFRAPARPNLYAQASALVGQRRKQELWSLMSLRHRISFGMWEADAEWIPYVARATDAPNLTELNQVVGHTNQLSAVFDSISDPLVVSVRVYKSTTSEFTGFTLDQTVGPTATPVLVTGLAPGNEVWVYLTSVDAQGNESLPSQILSAIPGSSSQALTCYTITDFEVDSILTEGPDDHGLYTYQFLCLWTAPPCGFTQDDIRAYLDGAPPLDPEDHESWPIHDDSWNWWAPDRILEGKTWDNVTDGQLDFVITFRTTAFLSGLRIYFRIWNSARTRAWRPVIGNYDFCTIL